MHRDAGQTRALLTAAPDGGLRWMYPCAQALRPGNAELDGCVPPRPVLICGARTRGPCHRLAVNHCAGCARPRMT